jgi:hypothetical protein
LPFAGDVGHVLLVLMLGRSGRVPFLVFMDLGLGAKIITPSLSPRQSRVGHAILVVRPSSDETRMPKNINRGGAGLSSGRKSDASRGKRHPRVSLSSVYNQTLAFTKPQHPEDVDDPKRHILDQTPRPPVSLGHGVEFCRSLAKSSSPLKKRLGLGNAQQNTW